MKDIIDQLLEVEKQLTDLFKVKNDLIIKFAQTSPNGTESFQNPDGTWTRISVADNAKAIDQGFFKTVRVERFSLKIETLKNMPKELKEAK